MSAKVENTLNQLKVLFLCGLSVMLIYAGRVVVKGAEINVGKAVSGMAILILVSLVSLKIKEILPLKIPAFAWASLISLLLTTPWCPIQELVLDLIGQIVTSDISDAIMAIAGISIGCKLGDIKKAELENGTGCPCSILWNIFRFYNHFTCCIIHSGNHLVVKQ